MGNTIGNVPAGVDPGMAALDPTIEDEAHVDGQPHNHVAERQQAAALERRIVTDIDALDHAVPLSPVAERGPGGSPTPLAPSDGRSAIAPGAPMATGGPDFDTRFSAAQTQVGADGTREAGIAAFLAIANDESLSPAQRARAFVAAGRASFDAGSSVRGELYYLRALGLDANADDNVQGARVLHLRILGSQGRATEMLPLLDAELAANQPVTAANRDVVAQIHVSRSSVLRSMARFSEAKEAIDAAIQTRIDGGATALDPSVLRLRLTRADILQAYGAQRREADANDTGADDREGVRLQADSLRESQDVFRLITQNPGAFDADTRLSLEWSAHGSLAERLSPRFNAAGVRVPHGSITAATITTIQTKFREAETLYNTAVSRPPAERATAEAELRRVRELANEILALDPDDGMAHMLWGNARSAETSLGEPLIAPLDTPGERQQVLDHLMTLAGQANISVPGAPAPQPRTGQGDAAIRRLFPEWDQLTDVQRAVIGYQILGYGQLIPRVIEQGAQYHIVGVGTSGTVVDPQTSPNTRNAEDRSYYVIRGWAYPTSTGGHFIQTGAEDIFTSARGGYPTFTHEFGHLVHGVMERAQTQAADLRRRGRPVPANTAELAGFADRIKAEFTRAQSDRPRVVYYDVEAARAAVPPLPVSPAAQRIHDDFLAEYRRANGAAATPPAQPTPPLNRFYNAYSGRNHHEYFAESAMNLMVGGDDRNSRRLFTRNPQMWDLSREIRDRFQSWPAGYDPQNRFSRVGLDASGSPLTLHNLRRSANDPHVARAARVTLDQLQELHNPAASATPPPIVPVPTRVLGDPNAVTHPLARQLITQSNAGDFAGAQRTAGELLAAAQAGQLTPAQYAEATTALTSALAAAEQKANWTGWDIFLTVLLSLLGGIPGIVFAVCKHLSKRDARALEDLLKTQPLAQRDEGAWRAAGVQYANAGGAGLANFRAVQGRDALRQHLETGLRAAGMSQPEAARRAGWMLAGMDEADRMHQSGVPSVSYDAAFLSTADRETRSQALLARAGYLALVDRGAAAPNFLGDRVIESGAPPTRTWDHGPSDQAIRAMAHPELESQVQLELLAIERQLAAGGLSGPRRTALETARTSLTTLQTDLQRERVAFYGDPTATPPVPASRPPEGLGAALTARRDQLITLHREVLGPAT